MYINEIVNNISHHLPLVKVRSVILYGNIGGSDIDVFSILNGNCPYSCLKRRPLDITSVGETHVDEMIENFDPLITEPLLTGVEILGNVIGKHKEKLLAQKTNSNTVAYLRRKAHELFKYTKELHSEEKYHDAAENLRFILSYLHYAEYYKNHAKAITFQKLTKLNNDLLLFSVQGLLKGQDGLNISEFQTYMAKTEERLTKNLKMLS